MASVFLKCLLFLPSVISIVRSGTLNYSDISEFNDCVNIIRKHSWMLTSIYGHTKHLPITVILDSHEGFKDYEFQDILLKEVFSGIIHTNVDYLFQLMFELLFLNF